MSLIPVGSPASVEADMMRHEATMERTMGRAVRAFLGQVTDASIDAIPSGTLVAAGSTPVTLGQLYGWWSAEVAALIDPMVRRVWRAGYQRRSDGEMTGSSLDELATYMGAVNDRLVRGLTPPLPDEAFNTVRVVVTQGAALGWSTDELARGIAAHLSWEQDGFYWRTELARANEAIDAILDPLGEPGSPVREHARLNDPRVRVWQQVRAQAVKALEADATGWKHRATLIARTESTGAYNYGALNALVDEGVSCKRWMATNDTRTRETHQDVNGEVVRVRSPFIVGGAELMMPGDPTSPAAEICNCRCTIVQADCE